MITKFIKAARFKIRWWIWFFSVKPWSEWNSGENFRINCQRWHDREPKP